MVSGASERTARCHSSCLVAAFGQDPAEKSVLDDESSEASFAKTLLEDDEAHFRPKQQLNEIGHQVIWISQLEPL